MTANLLQAALEYAARGWPVVPLHTPAAGVCDCPNKRSCPKPGKHPRTMHGVDDASLAEKDIERWWRMWPQANVGVDLKRAKLLDVAPDSVQYQAEFIARGLPDTPTFQSGGGEGHEHHLYKRPESAPVHRLCREDEFDIMSAGLAVMPPSLHETGRLYSWLRQPPLAFAPQWCIELLTQSAQRSGHRGVSAASGDEPPVRLTGEGLERWYGRLFVPKANGELDRSRSLWELAAVLADGGATRSTLIRAIGERDDALGWAKYVGRSDEIERYEVLADRVLSSRSPMQTVIRKAALEGDEFVSAADLVTMELPEPRWAVPGIFPEGVVLLVGKSKLGKSWLALDAALAVAEGGLAWGQIEVQQGDVLYLALEDSKRRLQDRLKTLRGGEAPRRLTITVRSPRANEGGLDRILKWLEEHPEARMVVIDVLGKFRPKEAQAKRLYDLDYEAIAPVAELARQRGVCVLIVHHANKLNPEDPVDSVSGTTGLAGAADAIAIFRRERGKIDASLFVVGRDVEEQDLAFQRVLGQKHGTAWAIVGDAAELKITHEREQIIQAIGIEPGMTPAQIAAAVQKSPGSVRFLLFQMTHAGQVRAMEGRYFPKIGDPYIRANALTRDPDLGSFEFKTPQNGVSGPLATIPPTANTVSPVSAVSPISANSNGRAGRAVCRKCGGELQAGLERIGLHYDCTLETG